MHAQCTTQLARRLSQHIAAVQVSAGEEDHSPTQLSHKLQWEALGGRNILQVKQYFNFIVCPLTTTSLVRGGGRNVGELDPFGTSGRKKRKYLAVMNCAENC